MPTPPFCALNDAYADWGPKDIKPISQFNQNYNQTQEQKQLNTPPYQPPLEKNISNFCPNCNNCLRANNLLQQRVLGQIMEPKPRWIPQYYPEPYEFYDPYNRYFRDFSQNSSKNRKEHFTNDGQVYPYMVILFILVLMFIIQLVELLTK